MRVLCNVFPSVIPGVPSIVNLAFGKRSKVKFSNKFVGEHYRWKHVIIAMCPVHDVRTYLDLLTKTAGDPCEFMHMAVCVTELSTRV